MRNRRKLAVTTPQRASVSDHSATRNTARVSTLPRTTVRSASYQVLNRFLRIQPAGLSEATGGASCSVLTLLLQDLGATVVDVHKQRRPEADREVGVHDDDDARYRLAGLAGSRAADVEELRVTDYDRQARVLGQVQVLARRGRGGGREGPGGDGPEQGGGPARAGSPGSAGSPIRPMPRVVRPAALRLDETIRAPTATTIAAATKVSQGPSAASISGPGPNRPRWVR